MKATPAIMPLTLPRITRGEHFVELPSAVFPGRNFLALTSEAIRLRNHQRWVILRDRRNEVKGGAR